MISYLATPVGRLDTIYCSPLDSDAKKAAMYVFFISL